MKLQSAAQMKQLAHMDSSSYLWSGREVKMHVQQDGKEQHLISDHSCDKAKADVRLLIGH